MLALFALLSSFLLGIRSSLLAYLEEKRLLIKGFDLFLSLFYFALFVLLFLGVDHNYKQPLLLKFLLLFSLTALTGFSIFFRVRRKRKSKFILSFAKTCGFGCYLFLCLGLLGFEAMKRFTEDRPILKVVLTGRQRQEMVEWKNPASTITKEPLRSYEVQLEGVDGKPLASFYVIGDQVAIRAKVIRFQPLLLAFGLQNLCSIDAAFNGYETVERSNRLPLIGYPLPMTSSSLSAFLWDWWEKIFFQKSAPFWIKSATLESVYFPLVDKEGNPFQGSYHLTINEGGLSNLPFNFNP